MGVQLLHNFTARKKYNEMARRIKHVKEKWTDQSDQSVFYRILSHLVILESRFSLYIRTPYYKNLKHISKV